MEHGWTKPRARTPDIKFCIRCDITYAAFLGTSQECQSDKQIVVPKPVPARGRPPESKNGRRLDDDDEPIEAKEGGTLRFRKPQLPYIPERRGCKGLYCITRAEHIHSGTRIIYL